MIFKGAASAKGSTRGPQCRCLFILKNNIFVNDIMIDLFFSSSPIFSVENRTCEDVKTYFLALHLILGEKLESCLFALICVGSATTNCLT